MQKIALVVPTIRALKFAEFTESWIELIKKHNAILIAVEDGPAPVIRLINSEYGPDSTVNFSIPEHLIFNYNDGVRNLGFLYVALRLPQIEYIISLDDDVAPLPGNDPIQDHLDALALDAVMVPGWISTMIDKAPRGLPYTARETWPVVLSHGVWAGVADYDAPNQLINGTYPGVFAKQIIPAGHFFPLCAMNFAFRRCLLPYVYQAPMGPTLEEKGLPRYDRFADIWGGISIKAACDVKKWAIITGAATIHHARASNVWANLRKEAPGLELNETFSEQFTNQSYQNIDPYVEFYKRKLEYWCQLTANKA